MNNKTVKHCANCQESFGNRFGFCPVCGGSLETVDLNAGNGAAVNVADVAPIEAAVSPEVHIHQANGSANGNGVVEAATNGNGASSNGDGKAKVINTSAFEVIDARRAKKVSAKEAVPSAAVAAATTASAAPQEAIKTDAVAAEVQSVETTSATAAVENAAENTDEVLSVVPAGDGLYHLTILEDKSLLGRLSEEFAGVAGESQLTFPEFKRDPLGFTGRAVKGYGSAVGKSLGERNVAVGILSAFVITIAFVGIIALLDQFLGRSVAQITTGKDELRAEIIQLPPDEPLPEEKIEGTAGNAGGKGGGSLKEQKKPGGGGGGGAKSEKEASFGKLPPASLTVPQIQPPRVDTPRIKNSLNVTTVEADEKLFKKDNRNLPYGVATSKSTDPSNGTGDGFGIGSGNGTGVGSGNGTGVGPGNEKGSGGGNFRQGGGGVGGTNGTGLERRPPPPPPPAPKPVVAAVTEKYKIISKPQPGYTEEARKQNVQGVVKVRVTLGASGQVTNVAPVSSLPYGLTDKAIAAARQIQFVPQKKNGQAVPISLVVEYRFTIY